MVVFETNRPWVIDPAVLSRISRSVEIPNPTADDLEEMLTKKFDRILNRPGTWKENLTSALSSSKSQIDYTYLKESGVVRDLAEKFASEKFVGRDITNFVILLAQAAYANDMVISQALIDEVR